MADLLTEEEFQARLKGLQGQRYSLLSAGGVTLIDATASERRIVQAARTTSNVEGKSDKDDRGLLRYLRRHNHTTPFEFIDVTFLIECPMDMWRQFIRHRTACLTGDTVLQFDLPGGVDRRGNQLYTLTMEEVYDRFQPTVNQRPEQQRNPHFKRERVQNMMLRCVNEGNKAIMHTRIVDIWQTGVKPVYRVELSNGSVATMSEDHLVYTDTGWKLLKKCGMLPTATDSDWISSTRIAAITRRSGTPTPVFNDINEAEEEWRPIPEWEEYYAVSNQGRVRRLLGDQGTQAGRLKTITVSDGRAKVSLNRPGKQIVMLVHRAMLLAFVGPPPVGHEACHRDDNPLNNVLPNLRWDTPAANREDARINGRLTSSVCDFLSIENITYVGEQMTYDLEVEGPFHNFSADGMIVHNSVNEFSSRYSEVPDINDVTSPGAWRLQSQSNRQGSSAEFASPTVGAELSREERELHEHARTVYDARLFAGVAKEQARKDLCLSTYTRAWWKANLHNIMHLLGLRTDSHAQLEIRLYANRMYEVLQQLFPVTMEAFEDYHPNRGGMLLSRLEVEHLGRLMRGGAVQMDSGNKREDAEWQAKYDRLSTYRPTIEPSGR